MMFPANIWTKSNERSGISAVHAGQQRVSQTIDDFFSEVPTHHVGDGFVVSNSTRRMQQFEAHANLRL